MPQLGMQGPMKLVPSEIDRAVPHKTPGNFALGYIKETVPRAFIPTYVGRADSDLNRTLKELDTDAEWFKWRVARNAREAWNVQCKNFHDFWETGHLEMDEHPEPPKDSGWKCPICE